MGKTKQNKNNTGLLHNKSSAARGLKRGGETAIGLGGTAPLKKPRRQGGGTLKPKVLNCGANLAQDEAAKDEHHPTIPKQRGIMSMVGATDIPTNRSLTYQTTTKFIEGRYDM